VTAAPSCNWLGFAADSREYGIGAQILVDLGITTMRLLTNNPAKYGGLAGYNLEIVERVPLQSVPNVENIDYLKAKAAKLGHHLVFDTDAEELKELVTESAGNGTKHIDLKEADDADV
jgi:3,4-dihydroxy 2-butanone 4-phosphate synthase/GTP cyclohydrolase II